MSVRLVSIDTNKLTTQLQERKTTARSGNVDIANLCNQIFTAVQSLLNLPDQQPVLDTALAAVATKEATTADLTARRLTSANCITELCSRLDTANSRITGLEEEIQTAKTAVTNLRLELVQQRTVAHALGIAQNAGTGESSRKGSDRLEVMRRI